MSKLKTIAKIHLDSVARPNWANAECRNRDPEVFFPVDSAGEDVARTICRTMCSIYGECRTYALATRPPFGVWGGTTESERKAATVQRHRVKCPGCASFEVNVSMTHLEICGACGLSWPV